MFDEFLRNCPMENEIKPSKKRIKNNVAAVKSLIKKEESSMTKRQFGFKPMLIASVILITSLALLLTGNADIEPEKVNFVIGGKEIEGEYYDYVDGDGFRHISFSAVMPLCTDYAIIYDVDAPSEEAVRVITDETDSEFMDKLRRYRDAYENDWVPEEVRVDENDVTIRKGEPIYPEDYGLVLKDSELCSYYFPILYEDSTFRGSGQGFIGGKFMHTGVAEGHPNGGGSGDSDNPDNGRIDYENETVVHNEHFYYYVGREQ